MKPVVAVIGATGAVGSQMITCLEERLPEIELRLFASERSAGKKAMFAGKEITIQALDQNSFEGVDYALGATGKKEALSWVPQAVKAGAVVIDNSSAYRLDENVPLVIPEVNKEDIFRHQGIIANPNCATIIALTALNALYRRYGIERMIVSTYQAVSGAGTGGIKELEAQVADPSFPPSVFAHPIAFNVIPEIGGFDDIGISEEEWKLQNEGRKIWHDPELKVNCTCVRIPVWRSHSESITIECKEAVDLDEARKLLSEAPGVLLKDDPKNHIYPMPLNTSGKDLVETGRLRLDPNDPEHKTVMIFCCGDQIRKGAATNAVQILEELCR